MPTYQEFRDRALEQGYSLDEVNGFIADKRNQALSAGYTPAEVDSYLGISNSDAKIKGQFESAMLRANRKQPEKVMDIQGAIEAGYQVSTTGLAVRGVMPEKVLSEDAPWYNRIASQAATMAGDIPAMLAGAAIGGGGTVETGPGAVIGAMGGAFALPAGLRAVMMDAYDKGEFHTPQEFLTRASGILLDTAKGYVTGAVAGGAGYYAQAAVATSAGGKVLAGTMTPTTARAATDVAKLSAEIPAMVAVGRGLEGELPHAQDFTDAAILIFGAKGAVSGAAKLRSVYSSTGKTPTKVLEDIKSNPSVAADLLSRKEIPAAYESLMETGAMSGEAMAGKIDIPKITEPKPLSPDALSSKEVLTRAVTENLGKDGEALLEIGGVRIVQSIEELPNRTDKQPHNKNAAGYTDENGVAWIVADNTRPFEVVDKLLHEVGTHIGMRRFVGDMTFQKMLDHVEMKVAEGDPIFVEARKFAEKSAEGRQELLPEETLAYVVERSPDLPISQEIMAKVRAWIYKNTGGRFIDLTDADIRQLAVSALRKQSRDWQSMSGEGMYSLAQEDTPEFKKWSNNAKVIRKDTITTAETGKPLVAEVLHGTTSDIVEFDPLSLGSATRAQSAGKAYFFTSSTKVGSGYAILGPSEREVRISQLTSAAKSDVLSQDAKQHLLDAAKKLEDNYGDDVFELNVHPDTSKISKNYLAKGANVIPAYVKMKNPLVIDYKSESYREIKFNNAIIRAKSEGYDGVVFKRAEDSAHKDYAEISDVYAVFDRTQIKSSLSNKGTFSDTDPRINYSLRTPEEEVVLRKIDQNGRPRRSITWDDFYRRAVDDLAPISNIDPESAKLFRLTRGSYGSASHMLDFGTFDFKTYQTNGKGLKEILEPFKKDLDGFRAYAVSKRSVELEARGIQSGISQPEALRVIADGATKYDAAFREVVDYQNRVSAFLKDSGVISEKTYQAMIRANQDYVPFYRIFENEMGYRTAGMGVKTRNPLHAIKGSDRDIADPIESIIKNTYLYATLATRNAAGLEFVDSTNVVGLVKKSKTQMRPIEISEKEMQNFMKQVGLNPADAEAFMIFRPLKAPLAENEIAIFRDGKREIYEVPEEVATAIKATDSQTIGIVQKILSIPASTLRAGAVLSPDFFLRNVSRDQMSAFIFSENNYVPFIDAARGAFSVLTKDQYFKDWLKSGGANSAMVSIDRNYIQQHIFKLNQQTGFVDAAWNVVKSPIEFLRMTSELFENSTRVGEFRKSLPDNATKSQMQEAGYQSREITLDFARAGSQGRAINMIAAFFNAQVQGLDRTVRAFKDNPLRTTAKVAAAITTPSVLLWLANHNDERYKSLPQWQKDMFWIVMTKDTIYRIPKPFELGLVFGSLVERSLDYAAERDPEMALRFLKTMAGGFIPNLMPTAAQPVLEQWANKSFFTGASLVPKDRENDLPELRYNDYTSETTKALGHAIGQIPKVRDMSIAAPAVIDNYIRGWSGGLGTYAVQLADKALRETGVLPNPVKADPTLADIPVVKAFVIRFPSASTQHINDFYDNYTIQKQVFNSIKTLAEEGRPDAVIQLMNSRPDQMMKLDGIYHGIQTATKAIHIINRMDVPENLKSNEEARKTLAMEKRQLIDSAYYQINEMAKTGNEIIKQNKLSARIQ